MKNSWLGQWKHCSTHNINNCMCQEICRAYETDFFYKLTWGGGVRAAQTPNAWCAACDLFNFWYILLSFNVFIFGTFLGNGWYMNEGCRLMDSNQPITKLNILGRITLLTPTWCREDSIFYKSVLFLAAILNSSLSSIFRSQLFLIVLKVMFYYLT